MNQACEWVGEAGRKEVSKVTVDFFSTLYRNAISEVLRCATC